MKNLFIIIFAIVLVSPLQPVALAQTVTPKPTNQSITDTLSEGITDLKEKIASRVAELDLVEKKGVVGTATEIDDTQLILTDIYGDQRIIDIDEITNFSSDDDDSFGISDIEEGTKISVLGLYNKETERLLARFVSVVSYPIYLSGPITEVNEDDFVITVTGQNDTAYTIDIETSTTTQAYVDEDVERAGFSDLEVGQHIFVTGFEDEDDPSQISASRILIFTPSSSEDDLSPTPSEEEE